MEDARSVSVGLGLVSFLSSVLLLAFEAASALAWRRASTAVLSFLSSSVLVEGGLWILMVEGLGVLGSGSLGGCVAGVG